MPGMDIWDFWGQKIPGPGYEDFGNGRKEIPKKSQIKIPKNPRSRQLRPKNLQKFLILGISPIPNLEAWRPKTNVT